MDEDEDEDEDEERGPRAMIKAKVAEVEAALFDKFAGDTPEYRDKVSLSSLSLSLALQIPSLKFATRRDHIACV